MSTRRERLDFQGFREKNGVDLRAFRDRWKSMTSRPPTLNEESAYLARRRELTRNLGPVAQAGNDGSDSPLRHTEWSGDDPEPEPVLPSALYQGGQVPLPADTVPIQVGNSEAFEAEATRVVSITRRYEWDMGHRLPFHEGKCRRLHGHRYVAEVSIEGRTQAEGSERGMVMDFARLDKAAEEVFGDWDHRCMLWEGDTLIDLDDDDDLGIYHVPYMPTAENIALAIRVGLEAQGMPVTNIRVYETPRSWADA